MAALEEPEPERRSLVEVSCLRTRPLTKPPSLRRLCVGLGPSLRTTQNDALTRAASQVQRESQVWFTMLDLEDKSAIPVKWKDLKGGAQDEAMVFRPGEGATAAPATAPATATPERPARSGRHGRVDATESGEAGAEATERHLRQQRRRGVQCRRGGYGHGGARARAAADDLQRVDELRLRPAN